MKEFFFLSAIVVISLLCSFYPGVHLSHTISINPLQDLKIDSVSDISKSSGGRIGEEDKIFRSGYCYSVKDGFSHSDFYQNSILKIPTSVYWKMPVLEISSMLILEKNGKKQIPKLIIPFEQKLPIVSLIIHADDFFSYENGIYIQGKASDFTASKEFYPMPWNKPANYYLAENDQRKIHFSYYDKNGKALYHTFVNTEISGKATRSFPQKSLRMSASKLIGDKKFNHDFFGTNSKFTSLVLRNGGNDNTKSLFRDKMMQELMKKTGVLVSDFVPVEVFINGEYWGIHFLQNRVDEDFIAKKFGCKKKNVTIVENWQFQKGDESEYEKLMKAMNKIEKLSYDELNAMFDLEDLSDYISGQLFFANTDWPNNNLKMFKISGRKNEKWRFAFFDLDYGFGYTGEDAVDTDMIEYLSKREDHFSNLFNSLLKNKDFKLLLKEKLLELTKGNLNADNLKKEIAKNVKILSEAIERHTLRWRKPFDSVQWLDEVEKLYSFAENRHENIRKQLEKHFE